MKRILKGMAEAQLRLLLILPRFLVCISLKSLMC